MISLLGPPRGPRQQTRLEIIKALMAKPGTQAQLVTRTGRSAATISTFVAELISENLIQAAGRGEASRELRLQPLTGVAVGIELGYQNTAVVARLAHQERTFSREKRIVVGAVKDQRTWLEATIETIQELVGQIGEHPNDIATVGMGIPRMVYPRDQSLTKADLPPWHTGENPAEALTRRLKEATRLPASFRVRLDNDANLGALAEWTYQHPHAETLIFVKASTGVGAGIVIGGQVFRGARGCAGEIGHIMIQPRGQFCTCGGRGCLETLIGADAMIRNASAVLGRATFEPPTTTDELVRKVKEGNPICVRVMQEAATQLGHTIGNLCNALNPNVVVLGGAFGRCGEIVMEPCMAGIRRSAMAATIEADFDLVTSRIEHATAHGALLLGIHGEGT